tara:strand:- start:374 stop:538 length:165 start_codon:yes stop_codon:yes gene_type:complete
MIGFLHVFFPLAWSHNPFGLVHPQQVQNCSPGFADLNLNALHLMHNFGLFPFTI